MKNEIVLIQQAQRGDPKAFEKLYERFYQPIYTYIYYRVGQRPLAEDLTGDVFERMVTKIDSWQPAGKPFIAWLYTIAGNLVRNHVRRDNRFEMLPLDERDSTSDENLPVLIGRKMQKEQLAAALHQLTEEQRQVIILRFLQGEPIQTVAAITGKTETGVKAMQRRAIQALRRIFEGDGVHV